MTNYAKYQKANFPVGLAFRPREHKLIEAAQCGVADEQTLRNLIVAADDNDLIVLAPVTLTLTEQLVIDKPLRFKGSANTIITGALSTSLVSIDLDAHSSAAEVSFENIKFVHGADDLDVIDANNTNASAALTLRFINCEINVLDASANGWAIDVGHATAGQAINLIISGRGTEYCDAINFAVKNASDVIDISRMRLRDQGKATCIVTSADALAAQIILRNCQVPHELGTSGGNAAQLLISQFCVSLTGTTYAALDTNDLIGSQTETIIG